MIGLHLVYIHILNSAKELWNHGNSQYKLDGDVRQDSYLGMLFKLYRVVFAIPSSTELAMFKRLKKIEHTH